MAKVHVLDKHIAELIAAGEVVERPCSVIKELVENSIDAGATAITVEVKHGGISYMRVTDNGCGFAREDVPVAFLRHATSKVRHEEDLDTIATLGFRGEALASVAAVSRVELLTRTQGELAGSRYCISGGEEELFEDAGCAQGSTIVVRDLFFNTPARMKFLKKDTVEANAAAAVVDKIALSHPDVSLRFLRDGRETLHTPGDGKLHSAVYAVFGREFTKGLLPVSYHLQGIRLDGYISKPEAARPNRSMQHFFINGRYVKSRTAMVALEEAFKGSLMTGKVPACVLHLQLSFSAVDVNVHPSKMEIRFLNEHPVFDCVYHGVKTALNTLDTPHVMTLKPAITERIHNPQQTVEQLLLPTAHETAAPTMQSPARPISPLRGNAILRDSKPYGFASRPAVPDCVESDALPIRPVQPEEAVPQEPVMQMPPPPKQGLSLQPLSSASEKVLAKLVGEAFGTYIVLERGKDELLFIDKHAAHERIIYERLKEQNGPDDRQMLLEPITVTLDKNEYAAVLESASICEKAGFEIDDFGSGTILVRSAPLLLEDRDIAESIMEIAGYLASSKNDVTTQRLDWLYHNVACRAAIKAGDQSAPEELLKLADQLEENPQIRYCPHGRPVCIVIKRRELEKNFGRIP